MDKKDTGSGAIVLVFGSSRRRGSGRRRSTGPTRRPKTAKKAVSVRPEPVLGTGKTRQTTRKHKSSGSRRSRRPVAGVRGHKAHVRPRKPSKHRKPIGGAGIRGVGIRGAAVRGKARPKKKPSARKPKGRPRKSVRKKKPVAVRKKKPSVRKKVKRRKKPAVRKPAVRKPKTPARPKKSAVGLPPYLKALKAAIKYAKGEKREQLKKLLRNERAKVGRETVPIDLEAPVITVDIEKLSEEQLRAEQTKLLAEQYRVKDMMESLELKKNKKIVRVQLRRLARGIKAVQERLGTYERPVGFDKESYTVGLTTEVDNVYIWEAKKFVDELIDGALFDKFIVGGIEHDADNVMEIHMDLDDLETEADMNNIYYFRVTKNFADKTVSIVINY